LADAAPANGIAPNTKPAANANEVTSLRMGRFMWNTSPREMSQPDGPTDDF
jgi:hypothetical protein